MALESKLLVTIDKFTGNKYSGTAERGTHDHFFAPKKLANPKSRKNFECAFSRESIINALILSLNLVRPIAVLDYSYFNGNSPKVYLIFNKGFSARC